MRTYRYLSLNLILFISLISLSSSTAYGASHALTVEALQRQIADLLAQVQALEQKLQVVQAGATTGSQQLDFQFILRRGSTDTVTNGEVTKLQQFLAQDKNIYPEGLVTGYFGLLTEMAVKRWQTKNGIEAVGIVGPKTRAAIKIATTGVSVAPPLPPPVPTPPPPAGGPPPSLGQITLSPSGGQVKEAVTITGSGFTSTGNDIHFGIGGAKNVPSFNGGTMITFQVPSEVSGCDLIDSSITACLAPDIRVVPGSYPVYVSNINGETATTTFTVGAGAAYPSIVSVSPSFGKIGDLVTVTGAGFTLLDNELHFGVGGIRGVTTLRKVDGTLLTFAVPNSVSSCDFAPPLPPCIGRSYPVVPGDYALYVVSANGKTNSVTFTVIK